jgi:hypothetical protein
MRRWRFLSLWALGTYVSVFLAGSFLPEWTVRQWPGGRQFGSEEEIVDVNLWQAIGQGSWWRSTDGNLFCTAFLMLIAIGVGLLVYWIGMGRRSRRPMEAADYKDAPGGAVPDGRVGPKRK